MNLPNLFGYIRVLAAPVVLALVLLEGDLDHNYGIALAVFIAAAATDFLDGYFARRWQITTRLGAFLDSIADKVLVTATLVALVETGRVWSWAAFVIIGREIIVTGLRGVAAFENTPVPPSVWGKIKTGMQFFALGLAMLRLAEPWGPWYFDEWVMLAAVVVTVLSAVDYFRHYGRVLRSSV